MEKKKDEKRQEQAAWQFSLRSQLGCFGVDYLDTKGQDGLWRVWIVGTDVDLARKVAGGPAVGLRVKVDQQIGSFAWDQIPSADLGRRAAAGRAHTHDVERFGSHISDLEHLAYGLVARHLSQFEFGAAEFDAPRARWRAANCPQGDSHQQDSHGPC